MHILLIGLLISCVANAQTNRSVYEVSPTRDIAISAASLTAAAIPFAMGSRWIKARCPCNPDEVNGFDRGAIGNSSQSALVFSDVTLALALAGPIVIDYLDLGLCNELYEDVIVFTQALAASAALVSITKVVVQRPIPRAYSGDPDYINDPEGYRSFYSGHAAIAFTALTTFAMTSKLRYQLGAWPWIVAGTLGTGVSVARVLGGMHFVSDIIVGAAMGIAVGVGVPLLHARPGEKRTAFLMAPLPGGAQAVWLKHF